MAQTDIMSLCVYCNIPTAHQHTHKSELTTVLQHALVLTHTTTTIACSECVDFERENGFQVVHAWQQGRPLGHKQICQITQLVELSHRSSLETAAGTLVLCPQAGG